MAKIKLGALAGEISGSIGCYTFSHNRGGPYVRLRNVQDKFTTPMANAVKGAMEQLSKIWRELPEADRAAWTTWASNNPVVDSLGEKRVLTGSQAFFMLTWRTATPQARWQPFHGDGSPRALRAASVTASRLATPPNYRGHPHHSQPTKCSASLVAIPRHPHERSTRPPCESSDIQREVTHPLPNRRHRCINARQHDIRSDPNHPRSDPEHGHRASVPTRAMFVYNHLMHRFPPDHPKERRHRHHPMPPFCKGDSMALLKQGPLGVVSGSLEDMHRDNQSRRSNPREKTTADEQLTQSTCRQAITRLLVKVVAITSAR